MSNHLHLCVLDTTGQLSRFMQVFLSRLAKDLNSLDGLHGAVFESRFSAIPVVDVDAFVQRIAYVVTNPVAAGLVGRWQDWTGIIGWAGQFEPVTVRQIRETRHRRRLTGIVPKGMARARSSERAATLRMGTWEGLNQAAIRAAIDERQRQLRKDVRTVVGMRAVLTRSPLHRPNRSKRSPAPRCFATCLKAKRSFFRAWTDFLNAFRMASEAFRAGNVDAVFPPNSHRPPTHIPCSS